MKLTIDAQQLVADLDHLGQLGLGPDGGITRKALSVEDAEARRYVATRLAAAGLTIAHDEVGNLRARRAGTDASAAPVLTGSHLDSVPSGGRFDGPLGVVGALVAVEALNRAGVPTRRPIEVVVFVGEEGSRFARGTIGSAALSGHVAVADILALVDADGLRYGDALATYGDVGSPVRTKAAPGEVAAFVELHVEQGGILEASGTPIGVVTAIAGLVQRAISFVGDANHAGATPMHLRKDALLGAAELALEIERIAQRLGGGAVGTVGKLEVLPGGKNIIPGRADLICDLRAPNGELLTAIDNEVVAAATRIAAARGLGLEERRLQRVDPGIMAEDAIRAVERAAARAELGSERMVSGAIHDALHMAEICASTMIFVPSVGGKSHCPTELTRTADLVRGSEALAYALVELAQ